MQKIASRFIAGSAGLVLACFATTATAGMPVDTDGARLSFKAEALFLERDDPAGDPLFVSDNSGMGTPEGFVYIDLDDFEFDRQEAGRFTLGLHEGSLSIEASFLHVDDHTQSVSQFFRDDQDPETFLQIDDVDISPVNTQFGCCLDIDDPFEDVVFGSVKLESELQGFELNVRHRIPPIQQFHVSILAGFRWIGFEEEFNLFTDDEPPAHLPNPVGPGGNFTDRGHLTIEADNDLFGIQLGGTVHRDFALSFGGIDSILRIGSKVKVGLMGNDVEQNTEVNSGGFIAYDDGDKSNAFSTVVEAGFLVEWAVTNRYGVLSLVTGYDAMRLGGVALATDHLVPFSNNGFGQLDVNGSILYHGPYVGARFTAQFDSIGDLIPDSIFPQ